MRDTPAPLPAPAWVAAVFLTVLMAGATTGRAAVGDPSGSPGSDAAPAPRQALKLPPEEEIQAHKSFDSTPDLQQTPGGGLVVNAFIMDGPVRVEVRDRDSGKLVLRKDSETLFPFEIPGQVLGVEPAQVVVRIYVDGKLTNELNLLPGH